MLIVPESRSGAEVLHEAGRHWSCPFCQVQHVQDQHDTGWVLCPIRSHRPRWVCLGCCIDIAATCRAEDFDEHPYRDIVVDAARQEGISLVEAREICLRHQLEVLDSGRRSEPWRAEELEPVSELLLSALERLQRGSADGSVDESENE
jgi:hypothetical protein